MYSYCTYWHFKLINTEDILVPDLDIIFIILLVQADLDIIFMLTSYRNFD